MVEWKKSRIAQFLKEREGRYKPHDPAIQDLKRLNKIDFSGEIHLSDKNSKTDMIIVYPGDLVISGINVSKGALAVYHGDKPITATIHYSSYEFDEKHIDIEYFKRFVRSSFFVKILKDQVKGGIKTEIKSKHLLPLEIRIPNIESQREVVSFFNRIETEMGDLSEEVEKQQDSLTMLRQSILQDAIEGKLTVKWRKEHPDLISGDNHAAKLLEKIKTEKENLIKADKIKKDKPLLPISDAEQPFDLPDGWVWCRLGEVIYNPPRNGYSPKEVPYESATKSLKLGATTYGFFDPSKFKYVADNIPKSSVFWLEPGDILIQRSNSIEYVGVSAIYSGRSKEFIYPDLMMKIQIAKPLLIKLFSIFLSSPMIRGYFRAKAKGVQKTMPKINQGTVSATLIPLPPLHEQAEIVERVHRLLSMGDELKKQGSERKEQSELLMQAVLREAFEGAK